MHRYTLEDAATYLVHALAARGFTLQRYDAYSTQSIYIKLDYGVANSIRISDHKGKKGLHYMFNVEVQRTGDWQRVRNKFTRYYYNSTEVQLNLLLERIEKHRLRRLETLGGRAAYIAAMKQNNRDRHAGKGFWRQSKLIHEGNVPPLAADALTEDLNAGILKF